MNFEINPYVGVGNILLGMTSEQIQKVMTSKPKKFRKFKDDELDTDKYDNFFVYYKRPGICEAIEFFGDAKVLINGKTILGRSYTKVKNMFEAMDNEIEFNDAGLTSLKYGVGVYAPFAQDEPDEPVESVIVFEKRYYD